MNRPPQPVPGQPVPGQPAPTASASSPDQPLDGGRPRYVLRLFVTGTTSRSQAAIANMRHICEEQLAGAYDLQIIDVYQNPEATRELQIIATPTLVKVLPLPLRRIIGDLSDSERVLAGLNLSPLGTRLP